MKILIEKLAVGYIVTTKDGAGTMKRIAVEDEALLKMVAKAIGLTDHSIEVKK